MRGLWLLVFILMNGTTSVAKDSGNDGQTVYCIGNHDATGACWKAESEIEEKLGCVITSWPIVECQSIPENEKKEESYECLALQNTGIVNQIALSCQAQTNNAPKVFSMPGWNALGIVCSRSSTVACPAASGTGADSGFGVDVGIGCFRESVSSSEALFVCGWQLKAT